MDLSKMNFSWKHAGAAALSLAATCAMATPQTFQVTPSVLASGPFSFISSPFTADTIGGTSASLIQRVGLTNSFNASGYIQLNSFAVSGVDKGALTTGLGLGYSLWIQYNYSGTLSSGTFGVGGSQYALTGLSFSLLGAQNYTPANILSLPAFNSGSLPNTSPSVTPGLVAPVVLGTGSLISGSVVLTAGGGAALNSTTTFNTTAFGDTFFTAPVPFYNLSLNQFNNTGQQIGTAGNPVTSIRVTGTGSIDFLGRSVPTPATLALVGVALLAAGMVGTRRRKLQD